mgnify:CR=1 FL=1
MPQAAVITATIERAVKLLNATGAKYKVIAPDGTEYGTLVAVDPAKVRTRRPLTLPLGSISNHVRPHIERLKVGEVAEIPPLKGASLDSLRSTAASMAAHMWGPDAHHTTVTHNNVELLRAS